MRPLGVLLAISGLAVAATAVSTAGYRLTAPVGISPQDTPSDQPSSAATGPEPQPPAVLAPVPLRIRPVAPETFAVPSVEPEQLERMEPREVLSPMGRAHVPSEGPPKETILHRPVVISAGVFEAQGYTVRLAGIVPTEADERCGEGDSAWNCGVYARTAFRNWLRGRALSCVVPPVPSDDPIIADCRLGKPTSSEWLVTQGWVRAEPGGPYEAREAQAREARRGIFGSPPASASPSPLSITLPETSGG